MNEQSNRPTPANGAMESGVDPEHDSVELIESEMDALRQRMQRLESRMARLTGKPALATFSDTTQGNRGAGPATAQSNIILTPASSDDQAKNRNSERQTHRRPLKKSTNPSTKGSTRRPRKSRSRSRKVKHKLLVGYGLLIGVGVASVFILMILNLFNADVYFPTRNGAPSVELELDKSPDLEELRMSIQDANE